MKYVLIYLAAVNVLLLVLMGLDKARAKSHKWRIPERTLFLVALLGGSLGGVLGMLLFRHKTRHPVFVWGFGILLVLHAALVWAAIHFQWLPME